MVTERTYSPLAQYDAIDPDLGRKQRPQLFRCFQTSPGSPTPNSRCGKLCATGDKTTTTARANFFRVRDRFACWCCSWNSSSTVTLRRLAPTVQRAAREMSTLLPIVEKTDVDSLKGQVSGELEQADKINQEPAPPIWRMVRSETSSKSGKAW
jgi:hypothetical protein